MPTVGELLRVEREKRNLSIKDIEKQTSIRALYLQAIEQGNYSILPGEVYLKGFIRNYANYLGFDGREMVRLYRESRGETDLDVLNIAEQQSDEQPVVFKNSASLDLPRKKKSGFSKWLTVGLIIIAVGGACFWYGSNMAAPDQQPGQNQAPTVPSPPLPQSNVQPVPQAPATTQQTKPSGMVQSSGASHQTAAIEVSIQYSGRCWTFVTADFKEVFHDTPAVGTALTWQAKDRMTVKLGNAGAAEVTVNGKYLGKLGRNGEVVEKTFLPE